MLDVVSTRNRCAALAKRLSLVAAGLFLLGWSGGNFAATRAVCKFACDEPVGLFAALAPLGYLLVLGAIPATEDSYVSRCTVFAGTLFLLFVCIFQQTPSHYANVLRVYEHECESLYQSQLACYGSLARNGLGVAIGVCTAPLLVMGFARASCFVPPSVRRDVWWLWLSLRVFCGGIGANILTTCPLIALGDAPFRQSADGLSFIFFAGPAYSAVGLLATPERRDQLDAWLG